MVDAFSLATIHLCRKEGTRDQRNARGHIEVPGTGPEIEVVPAGRVFDCSQKQFDELEAKAAVRKPTKVDRAISEGEETPAAVDLVAAPGGPAAEVKQSGAGRR